MSVYQYVYFAAVDKPLDDKQFEYMRRQSTRAEVTRWQFTNEYHYGDFHGNSFEMMRRGYDAQLRQASVQGTRIELPMTRRAKPTKKVRKVEPSPGGLIRSALSKCKKAELIDFLVEFSKQHLEVRRELEARLNVEKPVSLVVNDVEIAISLATDFDERRMNYNFDYDHESYEAVEKGLKKLIDHGELEDAKRLSLELMKRGSYQVACSDEGLMTYEIEDCLKPVIKAVKRAGGQQAKQWANEMIRADEGGFICDSELGKLVGLKS